MRRGAAGRNLAGAILAAAVMAAGCQHRTPAAEGSGALRTERCVGVADATARCHRLSVYENQTTRRGRTISLRIVVLPATGQDKAGDAIVYLAGGPGQAATELIGDAFADSGGARQHRDVIYADQRGTGGSHPLLCQFYGPPDNPQTLLRRVPADREGQGMPQESGAGRRSGPIHDKRFGRRSRGDSQRARVRATDARRRLLRHTPGDGVRAALRVARPRRRARRSGHASDARSRTLRPARGTRAGWVAR